METTEPRKAGSGTRAIVASVVCGLALGAGMAWLRMRSGALAVEGVRDGVWFGLMTSLLLLVPIEWRHLPREQRWWNVGWVLCLMAWIALDAYSTVSKYLAVRDFPAAVLRKQAEGTLRLEEAYATTLLPVILGAVVAGLGVFASSDRGKAYLRSLGGWMLPLAYLFSAALVAVGCYVGLLRQGPATAVAGLVGLCGGVLVAVLSTLIWRDLQAELPR